MSRIISFTETYCDTGDRIRELIHGMRTGQSGQEGRAIAEAAVFAADELRAELIVVFSKTGKMARHIAALRPAQRIIAFTPLERAYNALSAVWGIEPHVLDFSGRGAELLARSEEALIKQGLVSRGETIVVMAGQIPEQPSLSSMMKLHRIGE